MAELLGTVLDDVLLIENNNLTINKIGNKIFDKRSRAIKRLFKLSKVRQDKGLNILERSMLQTLSNVMEIKANSKFNSDKELIRTIYIKYKDETSKSIDCLPNSKKKEFYNEFKSGSIESGNSYLINKDGKLSSLIEENFDKVIFTGSSVGLGIATTTLLKVHSKSKNIPKVFGGMPLLGILGIPLLGIGGALIIALNSIYSSHKGYRNYKGKGVKEIALITMALVLKHQQIEQNSKKDKYLKYISNLLAVGEHLKKDLDLLNKGGEMK